MREPWHSPTDRALQEIKHLDLVWDVKFDSRGQRLATACRDGVLRIIDCRSGIVEREVSRHIGSAAIARGTYCNGVARTGHVPRRRTLLPPGAVVAARALYTCRVLFRVQTSHAASHAQIFHGDVIFCLAFEPQVRDSDSANVPERIVTGCRDGNLRVRAARAPCPLCAARTAPYRSIPC